LFDPGKDAEQLRRADWRIVLHIVIAAGDQQRAIGTAHERDEAMKPESGIPVDQDDFTALNLVQGSPADQDAAARPDRGSMLLPVTRRRKLPESRRLSTATSSLARILSGVCV
jgi:hypothetical protein